MFVIHNINHSFSVVFFLLSTDVTWRMQLIMVGVRWWWRDVTAALRPKSETLDDVTEDWDN